MSKRLIGLTLGLILASVPTLARGQLPYRSGDSQRLYIPDNSPRTAIAITLLLESNLTYPVNSGWIKIDNPRVDVFEVGGIIPRRGSVPNGSGFSGQVINAGAIGVYFWAGTESSFQDLQVIRRRLIVSMSNACGVAMFLRPLANFDFRGTVFDFNELTVMPPPSYCKQDQ